MLGALIKSHLWGVGENLTLSFQDEGLLSRIVWLENA